jgi:starch phosphorylase
MDMKPAHVFKVVPSLPAPLEGLRTLANNLRWSWDHNTIELFRRLDSDVMGDDRPQPGQAMLGLISQTQLEAASRDEAFLAHLHRTEIALGSYLSGEASWYRRTCGHNEGLLVAYFSAEFGITECLTIFAGGLGILAGDHLKAASDLGVPLVGVGLLYQQGYFRQYLNAAGWQQEKYEDNDFQTLPITPGTPRQTGAPLDGRVVNYDGNKVAAQVWRAVVGRVSLYSCWIRIFREESSRSTATSPTSSTAAEPRCG